MALKAAPVFQPKSFVSLEVSSPRSRQLRRTVHLQRGGVLLRQVEAHVIKGGEQRRGAQPDEGVVKQLKAVLGDKYVISHDVEMVALVHSPKSTLPSSKKLGADALSIGRPRIGIGGYDAYLTSLRRDRLMLDATDSKKPLSAWAINDELEMREVLGERVDGIITDNPFLLEKVLAKCRVPQR
jgi:hypothetical protein